MRNALMLVAGAALSAVAMNGFIVANHLAEGGLAGVSILVHYFSGLPVGALYAVLNIPLLALGWWQLGHRFVLKTVAGIGLMSLALLLTQSVQFVMDDLLLASLYGAVLYGAGIGLMIRSGGSSGGFDIIAIWLKNRYGFSIGETFLALDAMVLAAAGFLLGPGTAMYALLITFIGGRVIDYVQEGPNRAKAAFIITDESRAAADMIMRKFQRGVTFLQGKGGYTGRDRQVLMTVLSRRELAQIKELVHEIDPNAFVIISDVAEVLGEGFTIPLKGTGRRGRKPIL